MAKKIEAPKRGRGRPSQVPGMVAQVKKGRGKFVEVGTFTPYTAALRASKLQAAGLEVEVIVRAKAKRVRKAKPTAATATA